MSFALSVPKQSTPSKVWHLHPKRPLVWHALRVFANTLPARSRDLECKVTEHTNSPEAMLHMEQRSKKSMASVRLHMHVHEICVTNESKRLCVFCVGGCWRTSAMHARRTVFLRAKDRPRREFAISEQTEQSSLFLLQSEIKPPLEQHRSLNDRLQAQMHLSLCACGHECHWHCACVV